MKPPGPRVLIVLLALAVIAAVWSALLIVNSRQQTLDARVQQVASQLKCLICQGESVADSPSTLAQEMRAKIREQLQSGRSEQDVIQYFQQRYGDQIVWLPPWQGFSLLAWLVPIAFLLSGMGLVILLLREWRATSASRLLSTTGRPMKTGSAQGTIATNSVRSQQSAPGRQSLDDDLERYRARLEAELAEEDVLFKKKAEW